LRIFKAETKGLMDDDQTVHSQPAPAQPVQQREIPPAQPDSAQAPAQQVADQPSDR
jgi:hypothetical protein